MKILITFKQYRSNTERDKKIIEIKKILCLDQWLKGTARHFQYSDEIIIKKNYLLLNILKTFNGIFI